MDPKKLSRDPAKIHACLRELEDGRLVAVKPVKMYIPARFAERGLASIGIETMIVGIYAITTEDTFYGISLANAMMRIEPTSTMKIVIDGDEYYEFYFEPGSTVIASVQLVKTDTLVYKIYDEIVAKGRVPWYLSYADLGKLFDSAKYHAGANIGTNHEVTELLISIIARNAENRHEYLRHAINNVKNPATVKPAFIALRSVTYAATNTTNKLGGSYWADGLVSALVNPTERTERIEALLRK